jgi:hypothetical protein
MSEEVKAEGAEIIVPAASGAGAGGAGGSSGNWVIPKNLKATTLLNETKSFVVVRAMVYVAVTAAMFVGGIVAIGLCALILWASKGWIVKNPGLGAMSSLFTFIIIIATLGGFFGFLRFVRSTVLYFIKAAHIAAITEYLRTGATPVTEKDYKSVLAFGKEKVSKHLGATTIAFVLDKLVARATRQIMRWVNKGLNLLSFIPGSQKAISFINFVLSTALNFVDEAILSYIFYHVEEKSSFKKACDGLIYYAQAWKGMLMGATKVAITVWVLRAVSFGVFFGIFFGITALIVPALATPVGVIFGLVFTYGLMGVIVEPYATCMMVKDYHIAIAGQPLKADLHGQLCKVSGAFKDLFNKSKEETSAVAAETAEVPAAAAAEVTA